MKIKFGKIIFLLIILQSFSQIYAQIDSGIKRFTPNNSKTYVTDTSGDGRFIVMESDGDIATYNPRNSDKNLEIFLMDVAQRHIFQLTDTKSATQATACPQIPQSDIKVLVHNSDPTISNDGKWIVFSSNATTSSTANPDSSNPGSFDANSTGTSQILQQDGNQELWLYQLPSFQTIDIKTGEVPPFVNLGAGTFTRATNTPASITPWPGSCQTNPTRLPGIASDNRESSINDDGNTIAFISNRDLVPPGNSFPADDNDEIFIFKPFLSSSNKIKQVTQTNRGPIQFPLYNYSPSISGDGTRVAFASNATNPIILMTGGSNTDFSEELYFSDLNSSGAPDGEKRQVTNIARPPNDFQATLLLHRKTRSISRDGRYIVFTTRARLDTDQGVGQQENFANFIYDSLAISFKRFTPYYKEDTGLPTGDTDRYPRFTDYPANSQTPNTVVFSSRMNLCSNGSVPPACTSGGLNPSSSRPSQAYSYNFSSTSASIKRVSNSPLLDSTRNAKCFSSNSSGTMACTLVNESGSDVAGVYLLAPEVIQDDNTAALQFFTGGGGIGINSGSPQAQGLAPNMLGSIVHSVQQGRQFPFFATEVSNSRNFTAPLQLHNLSLTIDGISANITGVPRGRINFIVPKDLTPGIKPVVINEGGIIKRGTVQIIQTPQPDIIRTDYIPDVNVDYNRLIPKPYGRARILDVTDPNNPKVEPFNATTQTPSGTVPTKLRLFLTGVQGVTANQITIKLGNIIVPTSSITTNAVESDYPGIFTVDFEVPSTLAGAGHVTVTASVGGVSSRPAETASRTRFLPSQPLTTDLAVWRPGSGVWYILDNNGANPIYVQWGSNGDVPAPGDYDGDGKIDFCIFRPSSGDWWLVRSSNNTTVTFHFGMNGDEIAQADYDGDRITDFAVYRPLSGEWYILQSSTNQIISENLGLTGDKAIPADYDGDGKADPALWKNSTASFWVKGTIENSLVQSSFGQSGDKPVIGDYNGDGIADFATWRASDNTWRILDSNTNQITSTQWGDQSTDFAVQGDYDGDGKTDIAVWRSSGGQVGWWFIKKSTNGLTRAEQWGTTGDIPVPAPW